MSITWFWLVEFLYLHIMTLVVKYNDLKLFHISINSIIWFNLFKTRSDLAQWPLMKVGIITTISILFKLQIFIEMLNNGVTLSIEKCTQQWKQNQLFGKVYIWLSLLHFYYQKNVCFLPFDMRIKNFVYKMDTMYVFLNFVCL